MLHDLRYALRTLRRSPGFAASAILALALGIGANTAVFSVVYAVLLKPLPYAQPERLVQVSELNRIEGRDDGRVSRGTIVDWRTRTRTLESLAAYSSGGEALWTIGDHLQVVLTPPADQRDRWKADLSIVTPGYFTALRIPLLRGRNFTEADRLTDDQLNASKEPASGVAIVNGAFASRYFPGQDPVGRALVLFDNQTFGWMRTIVGVVADVRGHAVAEAATPMVFIPHAQHPDVFLPSLIVRSSLPPDALPAALRTAIGAYDPQLLVQRIRPMGDVIAGALSRPRFNLLLVGTFAMLALALAAVGIYGVVAYLVTQRTREIGIRMALGARARDVLRLVLREGMAPVLLGAAAGIVAGIPATRLIRSMLYGVAPLDVLSFAAAPAILAAVALLACYLPARRATRVDPLVALREE